MPTRRARLLIQQTPLRNKVRARVATAGSDVLDGNVAPAPGAVAHREPDLAQLLARRKALCSRKKFWEPAAGLPRRCYGE